VKRHGKISNPQERDYCIQSLFVANSVFRTLARSASIQEKREKVSVSYCSSFENTVLEKLEMRNKKKNGLRLQH